MTCNFSLCLNIRTVNFLLFFYILEVSIVQQSSPVVDPPTDFGLRQRFIKFERLSSFELFCSQHCLACAYRVVFGSDWGFLAVEYLLNLKHAADKKRKHTYVAFSCLI